MRHTILFIAEGFGSGRIPFAPGTWGSLMGLGWLAILLWPASPWFFWGGMTLSIGLSIWICGQAESALRKKDPPSVVLDEIVAIPVCFIGWLLAVWFRDGSLPSFGTLLAAGNGLGVAASFLGFRVFDIFKPWPVRASQGFTGGFGVVVDDLLAAGYVNAGWLVIWIAKRLASF
jgi:phosphatidylglycerophosphatase A